MPLDYTYNNSRNDFLVYCQSQGCRERFRRSDRNFSPYCSYHETISRGYQPDGHSPQLYSTPQGGQQHIDCTPVYPRQQFDRSRSAPLEQSQRFEPSFFPNPERFPDTSLRPTPFPRPINRSILNRHNPYSGIKLEDLPPEPFPVNHQIPEPIPPVFKKPAPILPSSFPFLDEPLKKPNYVNSPISAEEPECSICLETISMDGVGNGARLKCSHILHKTCLDSWIRACQQNGQSPTCPYCRAQIQF